MLTMIIPFLVWAVGWIMVLLRSRTQQLEQVWEEQKQEKSNAFISQYDEFDMLESDLGELWCRIGQGAQGEVQLLSEYLVRVCTE